MARRAVRACGREWTQMHPEGRISEHGGIQKVVSRKPGGDRAKGGTGEQKGGMQGVGGEQVRLLVGGL